MAPPFFFRRTALYLVKSMPRIVPKEAAAACLAHSLPSLSVKERKQLENLAMVLHFDADKLVAQENASFSGSTLFARGWSTSERTRRGPRKSASCDSSLPASGMGFPGAGAGELSIRQNHCGVVPPFLRCRYIPGLFRPPFAGFARSLPLVRPRGGDAGVQADPGGTESADRNLALLLLALSNKYGTPNADGSVFLELPLTRQTMAELFGVSVETLMRILRQFRERGYVQTRRSGLVIRSRQKLEELASTPELYLGIIEETL